MSSSIFSMLAVVIAFTVLVWWAFKPSNKERFNEYANMMFDDDEPDAAPQSGADKKGEQA